VIANAILAVGLIAWVTWIVVEPRQRFEGAYAEQGPRGEEGPRGPAGPAGSAGPVGPDAEDALSEVESRVLDVDSRLTDLEDGPSAGAMEGEILDLRTTVEDLDAAIADICSAISLNYIYASNAAIEELLTDLNDACP
jgi:hypothetical protein